MNSSEVAYGNLSSLQYNAPRSATLELVEIISLAVILLTAVVGNVAVLLALYGRRRDGRGQNKRKLSRIYFFILHLTIADLVTALLNVMPQMLWKMTYRFAGGPTLCKAVKMGQTLGPYLISYILVATAFDRYQAICQPLTYCAASSRKSRTMLAISWVLSIVFSIPQVTIFSYQQLSPSVHDCWASFARPWGERIYVTWYSLSVFIIPLLLLVGTYYRICRQIWRSASQLHSDDSPISKARLNTVKQTVTVIVIYVACSTPFICALLWASWDNEAYYSTIWTGSTLTILTLLSSINSCVNPLVYMAFNPALRRSISALIGSWVRPRSTPPRMRTATSEARMSTRTLEKIEEDEENVPCINQSRL